MVKLMKIYTRGGDGGETSLGSGVRVAKTAPRITVIGTVDETNATIGLARLHTTGEADAMLARIQNDLFDLGADLARPETNGKNNAGADTPRLCITEKHVTRLETEMDALGEHLEALTSFVLPGGSPAAAALHHARTVARRAERLMVALGKDEPVGADALRYINRLSDHLFQLARHLNDNGRTDVLWQPGENG